MESEQHEVFMAFLQQEGYCAELKPHDVHAGKYRLTFKSEGIRYCLYLDDADPGYYGLSVSYLIGGRPSRGLLLRLANDVETTTKAVKFGFDDDGVEISIEQFFEPPDGFKATFWRCLDVLGAGAEQFFAALNARRPRERLSSARRAAGHFLAEFERDVRS